MLSPPKLLDEIQPNKVCELLTCLVRATAIFFCLSSGALTNGIFVLSPGLCISGLGVPRGSKKYFLSNIVTWPIKLTGVTSRTECK